MSKLKCNPEPTLPTKNAIADLSLRISKQLVQTGMSEEEVYFEHYQSLLYELDDVLTRHTNSAVIMALTKLCDALETTSSNKSQKEV